MKPECEYYILAMNSKKLVYVVNEHRQFSIWKQFPAL